MGFKFITNTSKTLGVSSTHTTSATTTTSSASADPDPLLAIKQSVGCTHAISAFQLQSRPATRFLHEGDSFDLLPQYNPVPEVTAWLTSVCPPDNLELWLIGVPQVTPCEPDWVDC